MDSNYTTHNDVTKGITAAGNGAVIQFQTGAVAQRVVKACGPHSETTRVAFGKLISNEHGMLICAILNRPFRASAQCKIESMMSSSTIEKPLDTKRFQA